jgi:hypothetical protein
MQNAENGDRSAKNSDFGKKGFFKRGSVQVQSFNKVAPKRSNFLKFAKGEELCMICQNKEPNMAAYPCLHGAMCSDCGPMLKSCHICRKVPLTLI